MLFTERIALTDVENKRVSGFRSGWDFFLRQSKRFHTYYLYPFPGSPTDIVQPSDQTESRNRRLRRCRL